MNRIPLPTMKYPLIAILRGLKPEETESVVGALIETGFTAIEIPLNSPDPFRSIETAVKMAPAHCLIGAGTVLTTADVEQLDNVGGRLMVSPNVELSVIRLAAAKGMVTMPGVFTPTEALAAAAAGASGLKFFPASVLGPSGIAAIRARASGRSGNCRRRRRLGDQFRRLRKDRCPCLRPRLEPLQAGNERRGCQAAGGCHDGGL
ncbi:2-dehydro-3-deoxyphosphogalactonate aldolase [Sinorhizobium fredii]